MTLRNRIRFYQQLAPLARAGVPMRTGLQRLQSRLGPEARVLLAHVEQGETLAESFAAAGFSPFECHLVNAGEQSAQLEHVFERLAEFWNRDRQFGQALVHQLIYPVVVAHLVVIVTGLMAITAGPTAVVTTIVMGLVYLYFFGFVAWMLAAISWNSPIAKGFWLGVPLIGGALRAANAYRWITALRMEFVSGVPFPDAVGDAWRASGYIGAEARAQEAARDMRSGVELSALVERWHQLPRDWIDFFHTADMSGEFEATFNQLEVEAAYIWKMKQDRMAEWVPKILYFAIIIMAAIKIGIMMNTALNAETNAALKAIDDAGR